MSTVDFHRQAADDARAARDAATSDEVKVHHDRAWAAHLTAMNHFAMMDHYNAQALAARRLRTRMRPLPRGATAAQRQEWLAEEANYRSIEAIPARHQAHAELCGIHAATHSEAALKAAKPPEKTAKEPPPEKRQDEGAKPE